MRCLLVVLMLALGGNAMAETLIRAEKMTEAEMAELKAARAEVAVAEAKVADVESRIFANHKMGSVTWMEWSNRATIDGDYVLLYHTNYMVNMDVKSLIFK